MKFKKGDKVKLSNRGREECPSGIGLRWVVVQIAPRSTYPIICKRPQDRRSSGNWLFRERHLKLIT